MNFIQAEEPAPLLILNMANEAVLPRNFRTAQDSFKIVTPVVPSRVGMQTLRLSGSAQFSEKSLNFLLEHFSSPSIIYIIDLRQESHGFINGEAVSWYGVKDWANVGKTRKEIQALELCLLTQSLDQKNVELSIIAKKDPEALELPHVTQQKIDVKRISNEKELVKSTGAHYLRLPVTDHVRPTDETVDRLVNFIQCLPEAAWVHIHCAAGVGRTTTFMVMVDMIKNAKKVNFQDIIQRHYLLGGLNLEKQSKSVWKSQLAAERLEFLKNFYYYCQTNQDNFNTSWSLYSLLKKTNSFRACHQSIVN